MRPFGIAGTIPVGQMAKCGADVDKTQVRFYVNGVMRGEESHTITLTPNLVYSITVNINPINYRHSLQRQKFSDTQ